MAQVCRSFVGGRGAIAAALGVVFAFTAVHADLSENFDGVNPPALPGFWTTASFGLSWATTNQNPDSPPNCARAATQEYISEGYLDSPSIAINEFTHIVRFRHRFQLEADGGEGLARGNPLGYDGGVLEIAIGSGDYQDIIAAGGEFLAGGYNFPISEGFGSLIGGRQAWSGISGDYITTTIRLPASALNSAIRLRFRLSSDQNNGGGSWTIDSVQVVDECVDQDTQAPVVACPAVSLIDRCAERVRDVLGGTTVTDNCPNAVAVTQNPPAGTFFASDIWPAQPLQVIVTATDAAGNVTQCTTTLQVANPLPPGGCGICCGAGMVEGLVVMFGSFAGARLMRRRQRRRGAGGSTRL